MLNLQNDPNQYKKQILDNIFNLRVKYNYPNVVVHNTAFSPNIHNTTEQKKKNSSNRTLKPEYEPALKFKLRLLNDNKKVALNLIKEDPKNFLHVSDRLKEDMDFIKEAIMQDGLLLEHLKPEFKNNPQIVEMAIKNNPQSLQYASPELQNNPYFTEMAKELEMQLNPHYSPYDDAIYLKEKKRVMQVLRNDGTMLRFANQKLRNDPEVVEEAVMQNGLALQYASEELKTDKHIVLKAVSQYSGALPFADKKLQGDIDIQKAAVLSDPKHVHKSTPKFNIYQRPSPYPNPYDINAKMRSLY